MPRHDLLRADGMPTVPAPVQEREGLACCALVSCAVVPVPVPVPGIPGTKAAARNLSIASYIISYSSSIIIDYCGGVRDTIVGVMLASVVTALLGFTSTRSALLVPRPAMRASALACSASAPANSIDLVGDGGVLKAVLQPGSGEQPTRGATVEVHYEGTLAETGAVFDSSRARGKTFKFTLGDGKVSTPPCPCRSHTAAHAHAWHSRRR